LNWINEYIQPGTYRHYEGGLYVLLDVITDEYDTATGKMNKLGDPLIMFRDLVPLVDYVNGKAVTPHRRYTCALSKFIEKVDYQNGSVQRFKAV